jgi:hypothetical protein
MNIFSGTTAKLMEIQQSCCLGRNNNQVPPIGKTLRDDLRRSFSEYLIDKIDILGQDYKPRRTHQFIIRVCWVLTNWAQ